jgi:hypothetical protein
MTGDYGSDGYADKYYALLPHAEADAAEVKRLRGEMFVESACHGERGSLTLDACDSRCHWLRNARCVIDGWEPPQEGSGG